MMASRQKVRGVGAFTVIVFLLFAVLIANFFLTVGKDYLQYFTVRSVVSDVAATPGAAERTDRQLWSEIDRRFSINSVYDLKANEVITFTEDGSGRYMLLEYEVRRNFFANLDLVAQFNRRDTLAP
ncbi:DUF4845 domain-containing protein [Thioalkalivibrio sp.]|uniref:DUF4845 domain-containing protein n=1 Tax=Thioalkalivibrio sp. TaxID=2093813 RepID=UPI0039759583